MPENDEDIYRRRRRQYGYQSTNTGGGGGGGGGFVNNVTNSNWFWPVMGGVGLLGAGAGTIMALKRAGKWDGPDGVNAKIKSVPGIGNLYSMIQNNAPGIYDTLRSAGSGVYNSVANNLPRAYNSGMQYIQGAANQVSNAVNQFSENGSNPLGAVANAYHAGRKKLGQIRQDAGSYVGGIYNSFTNPMGLFSGTSSADTSADVTPPADTHVSTATAYGGAVPRYDFGGRMKELGDFLGNVNEAGKRYRDADKMGFGVDSASILASGLGGLVGGAALKRGINRNSLLTKILGGGALGLGAVGTGLGGYNMARHVMQEYHKMMAERAVAAMGTPGTPQYEQEPTTAEELDAAGSSYPVDQEGDMEGGNYGTGEDANLSGDYPIDTERTRIQRQLDALRMAPGTPTPAVQQQMQQLTAMLDGMPANASGGSVPRYADGGMVPAAGLGDWIGRGVKKVGSGIWNYLSGDHTPVQEQGRELRNKFSPPSMDEVGTSVQGNSYMSSPEYKKQAGNPYEGYTGYHPADAAMGVVNYALSDGVRPVLGGALEGIGRAMSNPPIGANGTPTQGGGYGSFLGNTLGQAGRGIGRMAPIIGGALLPTGLGTPFGLASLGMGALGGVFGSESFGNALGGVGQKLGDTITAPFSAVGNWFGGGQAAPGAKPAAPTTTTSTQTPVLAQTQNPASTRVSTSTQSPALAPGVDPSTVNGPGVAPPGSGMSNAEANAVPNRPPSVRVQEPVYTPNPFGASYQAVNKNITTGTQPTLPSTTNWNNPSTGFSNYPFASQIQGGKPTDNRSWGQYFSDKATGLGNAISGGISSVGNAIGSTFGKAANSINSVLDYNPWGNSTKENNNLGQVTPNPTTTTTGSAYGGMVPRYDLGGHDMRRNNGATRTLLGAMGGGALGILGGNYYANKQLLKALEGSRYNVNETEKLMREGAHWATPVAGFGVPGAIMGGLLGSGG